MAKRGVAYTLKQRMSLSTLGGVTDVGRSGVPSNFRPYGFRLPNLPKGTYEYLKLIRTSTGLSPWQVTILAFEALKLKAVEDHTGTLALVEKVKREHPQP